jgi:5-methylcytosine-specific restriction endonuclease McrA
MGIILVVPSTDPRYSTSAWQRLRWAILDRDRGACQIREAGCTHGATAVDHIVSPLEGGDFYDPANLRATCRSCNSRRGARLAAARAARYHNTQARLETRM